MIRRLLPVLLATACAPPPGPDPAWYRCDDAALGARPDHPDAERYRALIDQALALGSPAASAAVISPDGLWVGAGGWADLDQRVAAAPCQRYHVASVTKMFAASAALRLVEQGRLALDTPAREHLPDEVVQRVANLAGPQGATVRELLGHTSGIPDYLTLGYLLDAFDGRLHAASAAEELERTYDRAALFAPGTDLEYANTNFLLLSLILESIEGQPAYDVVHEQVTGPLGLRDTLGRSEAPTAVVRGYLDLHGDGVLTDQTGLTEVVMAGPGKLDGGLVSTARDVAVLVRALATGALLGPDAAAEVQDFYDYGPGEDDGPEDGYGLGLARIHTRHGAAVGHYGTVHPYQALAWHFPDHDTTVVLTTSGYVGGVGDWLNSEAPYDLIFGGDR